MRPLYFINFFSQPVRKKLAKFESKKLGAKFFFQQKHLIFSEQVDILVPDLPYFEFFKNFYAFLSYS